MPGGRGAGPAGELGLPGGEHSRGLRGLAAVGSARGSVEAAGAAISRATGVKAGKRQAGEVAGRAAAGVEAFCAWRPLKGVPGGWPLVLAVDGKGIVMLPGALRPAAARAARSAEGKLAVRLSPVAGQAAGGRTARRPSAASA